MADAFGYIHVQFPVLEQGAQDLAGVHATLISTLENLQRELEAHLKVWSSDARDHYTVCQKAWEADANQMATSLQEFGKFVGNANDHYMNTEAKNTGIWT
jgi:WXG100 family type VII secretion target